MTEPDPAVVRAAAAGDLSAYEELVRAYQLPLWRFLCRLLGDAALAEDVAQETFIRLYRRLPGFGFRSKFTTWLFSVARNAGIDALRGRQRRLRLEETLAAREAPSAADPEALIVLEDALVALSPKLREALLLVEVAGFGYREASSVLRVPAGTVKSRVFNARRRLADLLSEGQDEA